MPRGTSELDWRARGGGRKRRWPIFVVFFFLGLSVLGTYPLIRELRTFLPAGSVDLYTNIWNFWWWKTALLDLHSSPYFTPFLFAPEGIRLGLHTHSPYNMLVLLPVSALWGPVAAYNGAVLLALFLAGVGAYFFLRDLVDDDMAALAGAILFAFFPQHLERAFEHLNLFSCQFMPLALLFLMRTLRNGGRRNGILLGVFFALNALASWHLGILLVLIALPVGAWYWGGLRNLRRSAVPLTWAAVVATLCVLPFLWPLVTDMLASGSTYLKARVYKPIDPAFLFVPPPQAGLLGFLTKPFYLAFRGAPPDPWTAFQFQYPGFICFLGWIPIGLVTLLWIRRKGPGGRDAGFWTVLFGIFLVLALGRSPHVLGETYGDVPLPQAVVERVPVLSLVRCANRYMIPGSLAWAVLVTLGFARLPRRRWLRTVLLAGILGELLWVPFPTLPCPGHPYLNRLDPGLSEGTVIDIPAGIGPLRVEAMLRQTQHGRPILGGYVSVLSPGKRDAFLESPLVRMLSGRALDAERWKDGGVHFFRLLEDAGVRTILLRPSDTQAARIARWTAGLERGEIPFFLRQHAPARTIHGKRLESFSTSLERLLGPPDYEDPDLRVWHLERPLEPDREAKAGTPGLRPGTG